MEKQLASVVAIFFLEFYISTHLPHPHSSIGREPWMTSCHDACCRHLLWRHLDLLVWLLCLHRCSASHFRILLFPDKKTLVLYFSFIFFPFSYALLAMRFMMASALSCAISPIELQRLYCEACSGVAEKMPHSRSSMLRLYSLTIVE